MRASCCLTMNESDAPERAKRKGLRRARRRDNVSQQNEEKAIWRASVHITAIWFDYTTMGGQPATSYES